VAVADWSSAQSDAAPPADFVEAFDERLSDGWSWIREMPDGWRIRDGGLGIRPAEGTIDRATNLLVRPLPAMSAGNVAIEVRVSNDPTEQYEQCGIAVYYDDRQYVKLVKELVDGPSWIVMGCAVPEKGGLAGKVAFRKEDTAELRFELNGRSIEGRFRVAGKDQWQRVGSCELPPSGTPRLALITFHGPPRQDHWARFDEVRIAVSPKAK
jgi:regulation of enolase protein 1 (concanavalin A-like superfamily)